MILNGQAKQSAGSNLASLFRSLKAFCPSIESEKLNIHCILASELPYILNKSSFHALIGKITIYLEFVIYVNQETS